MSSTLYTIPTQTWVEITSVTGSVFHKSGSKVIYLEATEEPTVDYEDLPIMKTTNAGDDPWPMSQAPDGDSLWVYAPNTDAVITISPAG